MPPHATDAVLAADQLSVRRGSRVVLGQITFRIDCGESVAIVGPNGAGKTTLMLAMMGLLPADSGRVLLRGRDIRHFGGRRAIARQIAYVPQQYDGFCGFTVYDMVAAGRFVHQGPFALHTEHDRRIIGEAISAGGLTGLEDRIVSQLSGGERQKVLLAGAMAQQSPILFLDEPTTALDPKHQAELMAVLRRLLQAGKTLVVICHDLNLAIALGARVLALRDGALLCDEPITRFVTPDRLDDVFKARFEILRAADASIRVVPDI